MLPQTHFLVAFFFGLLGMKFGYLSLNQALISGFISILIDFDHLFTYKFLHGKFSFKKAFNSTVIEHEHDNRSLHSFIAFLILTALFIILGVYFLELALILAIAYYTHYILDHLHIKVKKKFTFREFGFVMKLYYFELVLQLIFLILAALILFLN